MFLLSVTLHDYIIVIIQSFGCTHWYAYNQVAVTIIRSKKCSRRQSMVRSRNTEIYRLWTSIQDIIGPAPQWPHLIRRLFWTKNLKHWDRILVCTFCFINEPNPLVLEEWAVLIGMCSNRSAINHMRALLRLFEGGEIILYMPGTFPIEDMNILMEECANTHTAVVVTKVSLCANCTLNAYLHNTALFRSLPPPMAIILLNSVMISRRCYYHLLAAIKSEIQHSPLFCIP